MELEALKALAVSMLEKAYCPYSHFPVGAALECADGSPPASAPSATPSSTLWRRATPATSSASSSPAAARISASPAASAAR